MGGLSFFEIKDKSEKRKDIFALTGYLLSFIS